MLEEEGGVVVVVVVVVVRFGSWWDARAEMIFRTGLGPAGIGSDEAAEGPRGGEEEEEADSPSCRLEDCPSGAEANGVVASAATSAHRPTCRVFPVA